MTIPDGTVTYAKMQTVSDTSRLLGRSTSETATVEEIVLGTGFSWGVGTLDVTPYNSVFENEGTPVSQRTNVNFVGAGVTVSDSGGKTQVSIPGGAGEAFPVGSVFIAVVSTDPATLLGYGTWSAFGAGRVMVGLNSGDADFDTAEETGGAKTVASAGTNAGEAAHTHSVTSNVAVGDHSSHTHTYTEVPNHTHPVNITDPGHVHAISCGTTDGAVGRVDSASSAQAATFNTNSNTTGITATTSNPGGGVATGTTAGPSATLTHSVTNNAVTSGAGSSHTHTFTGSATSVVQPYIVCYFWKRTA